MSGSQDEIAGRLLPGERILWSGEPGRGMMFTARDTFLIPFSLLWCGFAIFWEISVVSGRNAPKFFVLWGAMFVCVGLYLVASRFLVDIWVRRGTRYAVTDRRILIARATPFRKFIAVSLPQLPNADLSERANGRGSIRFGTATRMFGRENIGVWTPSLDPTPQFLMIDDVRRVFDLVQKTSAKS